MPYPEVSDDMVKNRVKASATTSAVTQARETAEGMVRQALTRTFRPVLDSDYIEAVLRVAYALYDGTKSSDGTRQQITMDGQTPLRAPRDPLATAQPIIRRYTAPFG